jgi:hypothetical protein
LRARRLLLFCAPIALLSLGAITLYVSLPRGAGDDPPLANAHYSKKHFPRIGSPLVGVNYTHYDFPGCVSRGQGTDTGILNNYHQDGIRNQVHRQLFQMRKNGVTSLRTVIWHLSEPLSRHQWGPLPSAGGTLREPYRSNLIDYVREVRRFGFARLTITFGPRESNNPRSPVGPGGRKYDPAKFEENWRFIQDVRSIVKRYGPRKSRFDLLSEGAVADFAPRDRIRRVTAYVRKMYTNYVRKFGKQDVTVSVIPARSILDGGNRLQNLINALNSTSLGQPRWYDVHIGYTPSEAAYALRNTDAVLRRNRLSQPLVVGETAYNDPRIARVIKRFRRDGGRRIQEVNSWYIRWTKKCNVSPPYKVNAFRKELVRRGRR